MAFSTMSPSKDYFPVNALHSGCIQSFEILFHGSDHEAAHIDRPRADHNTVIPFLEKRIRTMFPARKDNKTPFPFFVETNDIDHGFFVEKEDVLQTVQKILESTRSTAIGSLPSRRMASRPRLFTRWSRTSSISLTKASLSPSRISFSIGICPDRAA